MHLPKLFANLLMQTSEM